MFRNVPRAKPSRHVYIVFPRNYRYSSYDSTLKNLKIGKHTRVIFQGFTGRQATLDARDSLEWGTQIVGGVTLGRDGEHMNLPLFSSIRKAVEVLKPDASGIYLAAHQAAGAIEQAIEAEVPLIVAVAEHIPLHDLLRIHSILKTQSVSRLVGANSPGIISTAGRCRIGFHPLPCFIPGRIGIVARSGTLSYEAAASTSRSGLGQSMCIGVGGDILPGTSLKDGLQILVEDKNTEGIALIGEIGGEAELEVADWIKEYRARADNPKPIAALVAGVNAVPGRIMGHAGAFTLPGEPSVSAKVDALKAAGVAIVNHPSRFGPVLQSMLDGITPTGAPPGGVPQRRGIHTIARRPIPAHPTARNLARNQTRNIYLTQNAVFDLLRQGGITITRDPNQDAQNQKLLAVSVNRSTGSPCIVASPSSDASNAVKFDFAYGTRDIPTAAIAQHLGLDPESVETPLRDLLSVLVALFFERQVFLIETRVVVVAHTSTGAPEIRVAGARFGIDDAAYRGAGRNGRAYTKLQYQDLDYAHDYSRDVSPSEVEANAKAEASGIVYVRLKGEAANIGTLVNGAGLAMNTVDALADAGGRAANFLDTGGKATSETVMRSFEIVLMDPRVKCIFVNIFGGLTRGDMIAEGVVLAFQVLQMTVPVVVRIRGTKEKEAQEIIAKSGLPLFAFDDFDEAAAKAIELANKAS